MLSTNSKSEVKQILRDTFVRFPNEAFGEDTKKAFLEDWYAECDRVGLQRFSAGVKLARSCSEFFPKIAKIRQFIPDSVNKDEAFRKEMNELNRRRESGEKFYTLADVFKEFCNRVESGKVKASSERGQEALATWAKNLRGSEKRYAAKMLRADEVKRERSDFQSAHQVLLNNSK